MLSIPSRERADFGLSIPEPTRRLQPPGNWNNWAGICVLQCVSRASESPLGICSISSRIPAKAFWRPGRACPASSIDRYPSPRRPNLMSARAQRLDRVRLVLPVLQAARQSAHRESRRCAYPQLALMGWQAGLRGSDGFDQPPEHPVRFRCCCFRIGAGFPASAACAVWMACQRWWFEDVRGLAAGTRNPFDLANACASRRVSALLFTGVSRIDTGTGSDRRDHGAQHALFDGIEFIAGSLPLA